MTTVNGSEVDRSAEVLGRLFDVRDLRAVVTGAASGLGFAMAEVLADCGARVTLADIDAGLLEQSTSALAARGVPGALRGRRRLGRRCRCRPSSTASSRPRGASTSCSPTPVSASVPGFAVDGGQHLDSIERSDWDRVIGVNLNGIMFTIGSAAAAMKRQGSRTDRRDLVGRGPASRAGRLLRLHREQGGDRQRGAPGGARPRSARRPHQRDLPGPVQGHADRRRRHARPRSRDRAPVGLDASRCGGWQRSRR